MTNTKILEVAKSYGFKDVIIKRFENISQTLEFENNVFEKNTQAFTETVVITVFQDGKRIAKGIPRITLDDLNKILSTIKEELKLKTKEIDENIIDATNLKYLKPQKNSFKPLKISKAKQVLKELVQKINECDSRIMKKNTSASYYINAENSTFTTSNGLNMNSSSSDRFAIETSSYAEGENDQKASAQIEVICKDIKEINIKEIVTSLKKKLGLQFNKKKVTTGQYEFVFDHGLFHSLFSSFFMHMNARIVKDGISIWKNSINKQITSDKLTLSDNPINEEVGNYVTYDADGYPTKNRKFIDKGVLTTFVTNKKFAELLNVENTGNSQGNGVSFHLAIIEAGDSSEKEIISSVSKGILANNFLGMHSGINPINGDFSIEVKGNLIENGQIKESLDGAIVSGNFFKDVLPNIEMIGKTLMLKKLKFSPMVKLSTKLSISS